MTIRTLSALRAGPLGLQFAVGVAQFGGSPPAGEHGFEIERVVLDPDPGRS